LATVLTNQTNNQDNMQENPKNKTKITYHHLIKHKKCLMFALQKS